MIGRDILHKLNIKLLNNINYTCSTSDSAIKSLLSRHTDLFRNELGCYKYEKIKLDLISSDVKPFFCKTRNVQIAFENLVNEQIDADVKDGLLTKVDCANWGTPLVPVLKKDGKLRLCAETINPYLKDFNYPLPRIEDIFASLSGGKKFTKLDIAKAYNQLELDGETSKLLAWSTHKGIFTPSRLTFGTKPACSIFQSIIEKTLQG